MCTADQHAYADPRPAGGEGYDPHAIEAHWQQVWEDHDLYACDLDCAARPFYNLMEFPYPSGEGLHVGHVYTYGGADAFGRLRRMQGNDVFQPMGFDAFGIHAENTALKLGVNPREFVPRNIRRFRDEQMRHLGVAFNWDRQVDTTDAGYYRWTQWIFLQLYRGGLAYRAEAPVNWCPSCLTTLADEQVIDGACERCGNSVETRRLTQWFLRITRYADRLLDFSGASFTETTEKLQRAWIGRQEGAEVRFPMAGHEPLLAFSTRVDTLYGATFLALAPEHPALPQLATPEQHSEVSALVARALARDPRERTAGEHTSDGAFTGAWVTDPLTGAPLPIWVAEYVLMGYGSGAVFGVPAHDTRDLAFARAHDLPVVPVVRPPGEAEDPVGFTGDGIVYDSGRFTGQSSAEARAAIASELAARGLGGPAVTYRLRDWLISRQRYWGPPIPVVYCPRCGTVPVPEEDLPVRLPETERYRPLGTGQSPLAALPDFVRATCPTCRGAARRETDVSDNFVDSAWYYMRYTSTEYGDRPWDVARLRRWLPVHLYIGGIEHSTLHHLYARFLWKALQDLGHIPAELGPEPFRALRLHGTIVKGGRKMSKSLGNVVNPDAYVRRHGADVLRTYLLFMGPYERGGDFDDQAIGGVERFFRQVWRLCTETHTTPADHTPGSSTGDLALRRGVHRAIRKVTDDLERLGFNTAIAELMSLSNLLRDHRGRVSGPAWEEAVRTLLLLLAPLAPHLTEELWARGGLPFSIHRQPWPTPDPALLEIEEAEIAVQVDGRVRARVTVSTDAPAVEVETVALAAVEAHLRRCLVDRVIHVPGRLVNVVTLKMT